MLKKVLFAMGMVATLAIGAVQLATEVVADPPLENCAAYHWSFSATGPSATSRSSGNSADRSHAVPPVAIVRVAPAGDA